MLCLECESEVRSINYLHLKSCCGLTPQQYQERHPEAQLMDADVRDRCNTGKKPKEKKPRPLCNECSKPLATGTKGVFCRECGSKPRFLVDEETGCWIWQKSVNNKGYGALRSDGETIGAHRYFYQQHKGPIPEGMMVLHRCDRPACVNPEHLFLGTNSDNVRDMVAKGRQVIPDRRGEKHPRVKLTEEIAQSIINEAKGDISQEALAAKYGVKQAAISKLITGRTWKHLPR